jgi:hypothetical protein
MRMRNNYQEAISIVADGCIPRVGDVEPQVKETAYSYKGQY